MSQSVWADESAGDAKAPATEVCRSCGAAPQEGARYCGACGSQLAAAVEAAEYKQVTLLFADVVRSMDIAAALDIERLREIMTDLVERSAAVLRRYGGTVEYHGDGVMAIFGAPMALEDHAFRACLAAMAIQEQASRLAADVARHDGVALQLRVGLNSGRVIAGEIGSGSLGYAATGEHVGLAQRMESVAPPGGVMLSEPTARLVEHIAVLAEPEWVHIKGANEPVCARQLVAIPPRHRLVARTEACLVGRRWERAALEESLDRTIGGRGGVVTVVGAPGIGKSRVAREAAATAASRGVEVFWAFCESHARDMPFGVVTELLRAGSGVADVDGEAARARVRAAAPPDADPQDLLLLDDLLGIADPDIPLPAIDPDARRRRLTGLINTMWLARARPALFILEDAHWIDAASESMIADLLAVVPRTPSMVLITARPEYQGALIRLAGAQTIALTPLGDSETAALLAQLLGSHSSVGDLAAIVADRAAGNPFFAEEMVRELVQRGALTGEHGGYICRSDATEVGVPATVQATIAARIDRLNSRAKRTLNAASVIGARFGAELLTALEIDSVVDELMTAELIDQIRYSPDDEYAFRHPLIRAVAYESQLKSDRAQLHRRLATAIEERDPVSADPNAVLIAEHLEAAGERHAAYSWHMRAAGWSTHRDIPAARVSWERARQIADALPDDDPGTISMRIAPRTMLCGAGWRVDAHIAGHFEELRELCTLAGDKASLALGMTGIVMSHMMQGRFRDASRLAAEQMALLESIGDPALTVGAGFQAMIIKYRSGDIADVLRWSQTVIDWADGDPTKGNLVLGSPLAGALMWRGVARFWLGHDGWRQDLDDAVAMARGSDPATRALVVYGKHGWATTHGVLLADDTTVGELDETLQIAERSGDDTAVGLAKYVLGVALAQRDADADRQRGLELMEQVHDMCLHGRFYRSELPGIEAAYAIERFRHGDLDGAIPMIRKALNDLVETGQLMYGAPGTAFLVEMLLARGSEADMAEAQIAIDRATKLPPDEGLVLRDITLLRARALLARARGDEDAYRDLVNRYRAMAESLGFEGHMAIAATMT
ncbi:adenylate/guanylate cyclase domain-containing protein [Mycobacterium sp. JS623]|uniref:ATP-binding protein n=1 Tax=Mycobacterium sp. JS623 TaxID=212767 RepID=UPI000683FBE5